MTPAAFQAWLAEMISAGHATSEREAIGKLGFTAPNTATKYKHHGAPYHVGLACAAVLHGLKPYGGEE